MSVKSIESMYSILVKISSYLKEEGYSLSLVKHMNNSLPLYQIEGIKKEDKVMLKVYLKNDGTKTIQIVQNEKSNYLYKFNFKKGITISQQYKLDFKEKEKITLKLMKLKELKIIDFTLENRESLYLYKIKCLSENYKVILNFYQDGTLIFEGANSDFLEKLSDYLIKKNDNIIHDIDSYNKNLNLLLEHFQETVFQRFLERKSLSEEQMAVVNSEEKIIVVNAVAGSGKTTTLEGVITRWNSKKILYIVYNKKMKEEAEERFKNYRNVRVVTSHSLAYEKYSLRNTKENLDIFKIAQKLKLSFPDATFLSKIFQLYLIGKEILHVEFIKKKEVEIKEICFKNYLGVLLGDYNKRKENKDNPLEVKKDITSEEIKVFLEEKKLLEQMKKLYEKKIEDLLEWLIKLEGLIEEKTISETHDYYLKKYQKDRERIFKYEIVMLDEAQDSNEVVMDIMDYKFPNARKIIVGDTHQQIYLWRGAKNAMEYFSQIKESKLYNLTTSYRIGPEMAEVCSEILSIKNYKNPLIGKNLLQEKKSFLTLVDDKKGILTILFRKNFNMIKAAITSDKKIIFLKEINLEKFKDVKYFKEGQIDKIKYLFSLKNYKNYQELNEYISQGWEENSDIILGVRLVEYLNTDFDDKISELSQRILSFDQLRENIENNINVLGTIHGSKGYEFEKLLLNIDCLDFIEDLERMSKEEIVQELNLIYVGLTRSSKWVYYTLNTDFFKQLLSPIFEEENLEKNRNQEIKKELYKYMMSEAIKERGIKELIHFTKMKNLKNILEYGICSTKYLDSNKIDYLNNDFLRLDDKYDYISISVSFPNYKLLFKKRRECKEAYVVISINPEILLEKECLFYPTNAANSRFQDDSYEYSSFLDFEKMFENLLGKIPKNYPKDSQAEILIKNIIEKEYINYVYLEKNDYTEKRGSYIHPKAEHIKFMLGQKYFEKRGC